MLQVHNVFMRGSKGGRTGRAPPLFVGRNIFNTYHFCTGLEVRQYTPVWHTGTSLVGLKAYRHFFLGESHTGMSVAPPLSENPGSAPGIT